MQNSGRIAPRECGSVFKEPSLLCEAPSHLPSLGGPLAGRVKQGLPTPAFRPIWHFPLAEKRSMVPSASRCAETHISYISKAWRRVRAFGG
jgi:hypothetical protein